MDEKYLNKYRIPSNRLKGWDYGKNGIYFITICTVNRECFFGAIINDKMQLNDIGSIANKLWLEISKQFPFIQLGEFVIMPNHIHGLLTVETQFIASEQIENRNQSDTINCVSTAGGFAGNENPLLNQNISRVVRWYKGRCTYEIRKVHVDFSWQTRFYDHIVRDQKSLKNIEHYIKANPLNWRADELFS